MFAILDKNTISVLQLGGSIAYDKLCMRMALVSPELVFVTAVSFEEQSRGWLAYLNRAQSDDELLKGYSELTGLLRDYNEFSVLTFDERAIKHYRRLKALRIRIGTLDLRIASIALARGAKVITQNLKDFEKVPGLIVEDWTV